MPDSSTQYKGVITPSIHLFSFLSWTLNTDVLGCSNSPSMSVKPVSPKQLDSPGSTSPSLEPKTSGGAVITVLSNHKPQPVFLHRCTGTSDSESPSQRTKLTSGKLRRSCQNPGCCFRLSFIIQQTGASPPDDQVELLHLIAALGSGLPDRHQPPRWKRKLQHTPTLPSAPHADQVPPRWDLSVDKHICISSTAAGRGVTMEIPRLRTADDLIRSKNARRNGPSRGQHHRLPKR